MDESYKYKFEQMHSNMKRRLLHDFYKEKISKKTLISGRNQQSGHIPVGRERDVDDQGGAQRSSWGDNGWDSDLCSGCWWHGRANFVDTWAARLWCLHGSLCRLTCNTSFKMYNNKIWNKYDKMVLLNDRCIFPITSVTVRMKNHWKYWITTRMPRPLSG